MSSNQNINWKTVFRRGVTLVELMIVIAIAGIGLTLALPGMQQIIANTRTDSAAEEFRTLLVMAKTNAMLSRIPHYIVQDASEKRYRISVGAVNSGDIHREALFNAGIDVMSATKQYPVVIGFDTEGHPIDSSGDIIPSSSQNWFCVRYMSGGITSNRAWGIVMRPSGMISDPVKFNTGSGYIECQGIAAMYPTLSY